MNFHSIRTPSIHCNVRKAVEHGLAPDGSLYIPEHIPILSKKFYQSLHHLSQEEIAYEVLFTYFSEGFSKGIFQGLIETWCTVPTPSIHFEDRIVVELFHGPTQAFKDFGARWMAILLGEYQQLEDREIHILVATSGDTGGAVAAAFHHVEGIRVTILFPEGKVSHQQEVQMKSFGGNINVIPISGSFDLCQSLVKRAFIDSDLRREIRLSSANSINIARWIPQCVYYFYAYGDVQLFPEAATFVVPCGNLGNLSAGLMAQAMGLPVKHWIASTNENDGFLRYLQNGTLEHETAKPTLANAMDVALPNNLERIRHFHCSTWNIDQPNIQAYRSSDTIIRDNIGTTLKDNNYLLDPHTATAWNACSEWQQHNKEYIPKPIILATASPDKFKTRIDHILKGEELLTLPELPFRVNKNPDHQFYELKEYLINTK